VFKVIYHIYVKNGSSP